MASGRPIGRLNRHWTKKLGVVGLVFVVSAAVGVERAHADDPTAGIDVAASAQGEADAAVSTALTATSNALAQLPAAATAPAITTMETSTNTVSNATAGLGDALATAADVRSVAPAVSAPPAVEHAAPANADEPRKSRPRALPQVRGRPTDRHALAAPVPPRVPPRVPVRPASLLRSDSGTPARSRSTRRQSAPTPPAPLTPPTRAPGAPDVSWSGQGGGQGAFPTPLPAAIAGLLIMAFSFGLGRVIWWARPMPIRVALPPWRPG
jgi:hypothetical protein